MISKEEILNSEAVESHHLLHTLRQIKIDGMYLEFGVYSGTSINQIAKRVWPNIVHGFDSFEGLPEDWVVSPTRTFKAGHFNRHGKLPKVKKTVRLHKGWFNDTLPTFLEKNSRNIAFINIDCDIYSSTIYILTTLNDFIVPGTIIRFDELTDGGLGTYSEWPNHEYKALNEWLDGFGRLVEPISRSLSYSASIEVKNELGVIL